MSLRVNEGPETYFIQNQTNGVTIALHSRLIKKNKNNCVFVYTCSSDNCVNIDIGNCVRAKGLQSFIQSCLKLRLYKSISHCISSHLSCDKDNSVEIFVTSIIHRIALNMLQG